MMRVGRGGDLKWGKEGGRMAGRPGAGCMCDVLLTHLPPLYTEPITAFSSPHPADLVQTG